MAEVVESSPERLVCRAEPGKVWTGLLFAALGVALALGLVPARARTPGGEGPVVDLVFGLLVVWMGLAYAGPEDLRIDLLGRRYRLRAGPLFLARWQEGPLEDFDRLRLAKQRGLTAWLIRLEWKVPGRRPFDLESIRDTGREGTDPRQVALWLMHRYAARLGIRAEGAKPVPDVPERAPQPATPAAPRKPEVAVRTRRYRVAGSQGRLRMVKSPLFILERDWGTVFWASMAGPILGYILWGTGALWGVLTDLPRIFKESGLAAGHLPAEPTARGTVVLGLSAAAALLFFSGVALYAWLVLARSAVRVALGEEHRIDLAADVFSYNGKGLGKASEVVNVQVRQHTEPEDSRRHRSWYNLIFVLRDGTRFTLVYDGPRDELVAVSKALADFLGVPALTN